MKVTIEEVDSCFKNLTLEIPREKVQEAFQTEYKRFRGKAQIAGFRKGKVPLPLIKRYYSAEVKEEVLKKMFTEYFYNALKENNLHLVGEPDIKSMELEEDKPMLLNISIEVVPEITVEGFEGLELTREKVKVNEKDIDNYIEKLREQAGQMVTVENRESRHGDYMIVEFTAEIDDEKINEGKSQEISFILGKDQFIPGIGLDEQLIGLKVGDEKTLQQMFPEDYETSEIAGKKLEVNIKVKELKEKQLPEINDDFAKDLGDYESLEELRKHVREQLMESYEKTIKNELKEQILDKLIELNKIDSPPTFVKEEYNRLIELNKSQKGVKIEDLDEMEREKFKSMAEISVKKSLIIQLVAKQAGLKVTDEHVNKYLEPLAKQDGRSVASLRADFDKTDYMDYLENKLLEEMTLDYLLDKANITVQESSQEEKQC